ncbi:hypothetical protein [Chitinophaga sp. Cy-1792]|uniref:hypothetical protein n=1 Tax=Chitinophaga sp. Cy-1792 TaxID=2608339 RepID=UPI001424899E|nr:hypothetical protein [Chitinophaga sp. Cy-1792]NIG56002.1 hypothetical protein [Chitinophaga sp. Cy-1792]
MRKIILLIGLIFAANVCLAVAPAFDLEKEMVGKIAAYVNAIVEENAYNDAHNQSYLNRYIISVDASKLLAVDPNKFLFQDTDFGNESYISTNDEKELNGKLLTAKTNTSISPYLLIINNLALVDGGNIYDGITTKDIFDETNLNIDKEKYYPRWVALEKEKAFIEKLKSELGNKLNNAMFVCWTRFITVKMGVDKGDYYETFVPFNIGIDNEVIGRFKELIKSASWTNDKKERATSFVRLMTASMNAFSKAKPKSGPGLIYYETYEGYKGVSADLLAKIGNLINEMGVDVYNQYQEDIKHATGAIVSEDAFQEYYNSLLAYQGAFRVWKEKLGSANDKNRILLQFVLSKSREGWFKALDIDTRIRVLNIVGVKGFLLSMHNLWVDDRDGYGGEEFMLAILKTVTTTADKKRVLDELKKNKLLEHLVKEMDGDAFGLFVSYVVNMILDVYPRPESDHQQMVLKNRFIPFDYDFFSKTQNETLNDNGSLSFNVEGTTFILRQDAFEEKTVTLASLTADPYEYILIRFESDCNLGSKLHFEKNSYATLPAIFCYFLFNEHHNKQIAKSASLILNTGMFALGVGELAAFFQGANGMTAALAMVDMGVSVMNIRAEDYLDRDPDFARHHPNYIRVLKAINLAYGAGRLSYEMNVALGGAYKTANQIIAEANLTEAQVELVRQIMTDLKGKDVLKLLDAGASGVAQLGSEWEQLLVQIEKGGFTKLGNQLKNADETFQKIFAQDFLNADKNVLTAFNNDPELFNIWANIFRSKEIGYLRAVEHLNKARLIERFSKLSENKKALFLNDFGGASDEAVLALNNDLTLIDVWENVYRSSNIEHLEALSRIKKLKLVNIEKKVADMTEADKIKFAGRFGRSSDDVWKAVDSYVDKWTKWKDEVFIGRKEFDSYGDLWNKTDLDGKEMFYEESGNYVIAHTRHNKVQGDYNMARDFAAQGYNVELLNEKQATGIKTPDANVKGIGIFDFKALEADDVEAIIKNVHDYTLGTKAQNADHMAFSMKENPYMKVEYVNQGVSLALETVDFSGVRIADKVALIYPDGKIKIIDINDFRNGIRF